MGMFKYISCVCGCGVDRFGGAMKARHWSESKQAAFLTLLCELPTQSVICGICVGSYLLHYKSCPSCVFMQERKQASFMLSQMSLQKLLLWNVWKAFHGFWIP